MHYISTRGHVAAQQFSEILLAGLAPDGGLYLPAAYPQVSGAELDAWRTLSYADLAFEILSRFATDIPAEDLRMLVRKTYTPEVYRNVRSGEQADQTSPATAAPRCRRAHTSRPGSRANTALTGTPAGLLIGGMAWKARKM